MSYEPAKETKQEKRNSGHTGPTSATGKATSARNATRHGMCAKTLIMEGEVEAGWLDLLQSRLEALQNPAESTLLYAFVMKTAQAEWHRLRPIENRYQSPAATFRKSPSPTCLGPTLPGARTIRPSAPLRFRPTAPISMSPLDPPPARTPRRPATAAMGMIWENQTACTKNL